MHIGLINYGSGNFASVWNALAHLRLDVVEVARAEDMDSCSRFILPGVGSFPDCMEGLQSCGLVAALRSHVVEQKKPYLGICLGMQILAELGFEFRACRGLGWIAGEVRRISTGSESLPIPHIGWNELSASSSCPLFKGMGEKPTFYFVHSYHVLPVDQTDLLASVDYGDQVTACIGRGHIYGVQFHPEKSQQDGLRLLQNFAEIEPSVVRC